MRETASGRRRRRRRHLHPPSTEVECHRVTAAATVVFFESYIICYIYIRTAYNNSLAAVLYIYYFVWLLYINAARVFVYYSFFPFFFHSFHRIIIIIICIIYTFATIVRARARVSSTFFSYKIIYTHAFLLLGIIFFSLRFLLSASPPRQRLFPPPLSAVVFYIAYLPSMYVYEPQQHYQLL